MSDAGPDGTWRPNRSNAPTDTDVVLAAQRVHPIEETYGKRVYISLLDLVDLEQKAANIVRHGRARYDGDEVLRLAAEAVVTRIGEAVSRLTSHRESRHLGQQFRSDHPDINFAGMRGMRKFTSHDYDLIDHNILWIALSQDFPEDVERIKRLL